MCLGRGVSIGGSRRVQLCCLGLHEGQEALLPLDRGLLSLDHSFLRWTAASSRRLSRSVRQAKFSLSVCRSVDYVGPADCAMLRYSLVMGPLP